MGKSKFDIRLAKIQDFAKKWCDYWSKRIDQFDDYETRLDYCADYYLEDFGDRWKDAVELYNCKIIVDN